MTIIKHEDALQFSLNVESASGSVLATVYHGERRLCRITLNNDRLMVSVDDSQSTGFQSVHCGVGWSSATWTLPEHFPNDLFDDSDKESE